jgi:predicted flap endonuclease-1-like 5' DNA nuclease
MIEWASDYWYLCLIAFVIGVLTAAWIWLTVNADASLPAREIDEPAAPAAPLEPARPVIERAEPVNFAATPPPAPEPVAAPVAAAPMAAMAAPSGDDRPAIAAAVGAPDNLMDIKGVGPKLNTLLNSLGVTRFDQIAAWGANEIAEVDRFLGSFKGRIVRDSWVEQAGLLARGDIAGFAAKFGEVGSEHKKG